MSTAAVDAPWQSEYERLVVHCTTCPTCTAVDGEGVNLKLPCAEDERVTAMYRRARSAADRL